MSTEPALMSLVAVAKAIADQGSVVARGDAVLPAPDREWQPRLNAFMAIEAEARACGG